MHFRVVGVVLMSANEDPAPKLRVQMARRAGAVFWWVGFVVPLLLVVLLCWWVIKDAESGMRLVRSLGLSMVMWPLMFWAVAYVLGGSFWKPPRT